MQIVKFNNSINVLLTWNLDMLSADGLWSSWMQHRVSWSMVAEGIKCPISLLSDTNSASSFYCKETKYSLPSIIEGRGVSGIKSFYWIK